jgi:dTMP kinase
MRGLFITLEGPEGSGKSTQAGILASRFETLGREVVLTREPGGTATGELIREVLQHNHTGEPIAPAAEALLFGASRAQLVNAVIRPALERGACVLCDRFADSTTVYQGQGRGFGMEQMLEINRFAVQGTMPNITLLLDVTVEQGFARVNQRNLETGAKRDRFEQEAMAFHEQIRHGYLALAKLFPERIVRVDASGDQDETAHAVWQAVKLRLSASDVEIGEEGP